MSLHKQIMYDPWNPLFLHFCKNKCKQTTAVKVKRRIEYNCWFQCCDKEFVLFGILFMSRNRPVEKIEPLTFLQNFNFRYLSNKISWNKQREEAVWDYSFLWQDENSSEWLKFNQDYKLFNCVWQLIFSRLLNENIRNFVWNT